MSGNLEASYEDRSVARRILTEDIIGEGRTVDQYGIMGWARDHFRELLRRHGNLKYEDAITLALEDMDDIAPEDVVFARNCLLELMQTNDRTLDDMGLEHDSKNIMRKVIAKIHGHNEGTTIAA